MKPTGRGGFTLVELLTALVMLTVVGNAILALVISMQRITRQQSEVAALQGALRSGVQLLQTELVELAPEDITAMTSSRLGYRAMRGLGESCELSLTTLKIGKSSYAGLRPPTVDRDGIWLYLDGDTTTASDDRWAALDLLGVAPGTCPDGGDAWALSISIDAADLAAAGVPGPLRTYESMEIGQVYDEGFEWLGIRSIGLDDGLVPVTGPVTANGVRFSYLDGSDLPTATASAVRTILVTVRGISERPAGVRGADLLVPADSLTLRIRLRN